VRKVSYRRRHDMAACVCVCGADELLGEKEKYKTISEDLDFTFTELAGF